MPNRIDRTPIATNRTRTEKGGQHVPTRAGIQAHLDYTNVVKRQGQEKLSEWSVKEKRAKQHRSGNAIHPEFRNMTPIQLDRFISNAEAEFWLADQQVKRCDEEILRLKGLLER